MRAFKYLQQQSDGLVSGLDEFEDVHNMRDGKAGGDALADSAHVGVVVEDGGGVCACLLVGQHAKHLHALLADQRRALRAWLADDRERKGDDLRIQVLLHEHLCWLLPTASVCTRQSNSTHDRCQALPR